MRTFTFSPPLLASALALRFTRRQRERSRDLPAHRQCRAARNSAKSIELGVEIVNGAHPELKDLPLAATAAAHLGGAKIELVSADHRQSVGRQNQTLPHQPGQVVAMLGAYHSSVALTATAAAERQAFRFWWRFGRAQHHAARLQMDFRVGPIAPDFAKASRLPQRSEEVGKKIDSIAVVNENTDTAPQSRPPSLAPQGRRITSRQIPYNATRPTCPARCFSSRTRSRHP